MDAGKARALVGLNVIVASLRDRLDAYDLGNEAVKAVRRTRCECGKLCHTCVVCGTCAECHDKRSAYRAP